MGLLEIWVYSDLSLLRVVSCMGHRIDEAIEHGCADCIASFLFHSILLTKCWCQFLVIVLVFLTSCSVTPHWVGTPSTFNIRFKVKAELTVFQCVIAGCSHGTCPVLLQLWDYLGWSFARVSFSDIAWWTRNTVFICRCIETIEVVICPSNLLANFEKTPHACRLFPQDMVEYKPLGFLNSLRHVAPYALTSHCGSCISAEVRFFEHVSFKKWGHRRWHKSWARCNLKVCTT